MVLLAEEVIHIIKCILVKVKLVHTQECYDQLPVIRNNETFLNFANSHLVA